MKLGIKCTGDGCSDKDTCKYYDKDITKYQASVEPKNIMQDGDCKEYEENK